jgi:hypothetical protein
MSLRFKGMDQDLTKKISLDLSLGHLLLVWEVLSNKISCDPIKKQLSEIERRAIWALEDLCENKLVENDCGARPKQEWESLIKRAGDHVKSIQVDFLDD